MSPEGTSWTGNELGPNDQEINPTPWRKPWKPKPVEGVGQPKDTAEQGEKLPPGEYSDYA